MDQILSNLWIKDAVKTSVLSKKWRYKYATLLSLVFDDQLFPAPSASDQTDDEMKKANKLVSLINRVLLLHCGPIHKFELSVDFTFPAEEIEKWIIFLSRRHLKSFVFEGCSRQMQFRVPFSIFSCQSLTNLELSKCLLTSTFRGFENLKSLRLSWINASEDVLESLISNSPMLEILDLRNCYRIKYLRVNAPNVQQLTIRGSLFRLSLKNTPRLTLFYIDTYLRDATYKNGIYITKLLAGMPQIQRLDIGHDYLACMTIGDVPRDIPVSPVKLNQLSIGVNFSKFKETLYLLCLLKCAPNLQELQIQCEYEQRPSTNNWESEDLNGLFTHLRYLKFNYMSGSKAEMDFIRFILLTLPALETMTIQLSTYHLKEQELITVILETVKVTKQLLSFSRASPNAKIIIS